MNATKQIQIAYDHLVADIDILLRDKPKWTLAQCYDWYLRNRIEEIAQAISQEQDKWAK